MQLRSKNMFALLLMVLILFSTIGVNIITTFCDGCTDEHTALALAPVDEISGCECCDNNAEKSECCAIPDDQHAQKHHDTRSVFAKLSLDVPAAKDEVIDIEAPVFLLHFITNLLFSSIQLPASGDFLTQNQAPPLAGRSLLQLVCVLRN